MFLTLRLIILVICFISFLLLLNRFRVGRKTWNTKTRDYWYALTMWTFATACAAFESIVRHLDGRYTLVLSLAAAVVTLVGVLRKGRWGGGK